MTKQAGSTSDAGVEVRPGPRARAPRDAREVPVRPSDSQRAGVPSVGQVEAARALLLTHRLDVESGGCVGCGAACPCETANGAASVVVAAGAWNTLPPMRPRTGWTGAGEDGGGALSRALTLFRSARARRQGPAPRSLL